MLLLGRYLSPFVRRVAATLNLYEIQFVNRPLQHTGDDAPTLRISNPVGRVPALVLDDDRVIVDSSAILDHLDRRVGPVRALTPTDGAERDRALTLIGIALGATEKAIATAYEVRFRPPEHRHQPWVDRCADQALGGFGYLEGQLADDWFLGEKMSQVDVTTAVAWQYVARGTPRLKAALEAPRLDALVARMMALPAFASTLPES